MADGLVAFVAATDLVYPCYALYMNSADRHDVRPIGDLHQQRFTSIWDGPLRHDVVTAIDATRCPYCRFQGHNSILWSLADDQPSGYERDDNDPHRNFL